jgi:hypothetical protein
MRLFVLLHDVASVAAWFLILAAGVGIIGAFGVLADGGMRYSMAAATVFAVVWIGFGIRKVVRLYRSTTSSGNAG